MCSKAVGSFVASLFMTFAAAAFAQGPEELIYPGHPTVTDRPAAADLQVENAVTQTVEDGAICTTIDFEGVGDLAPIPDFDGISSPGWLGIIDRDAGGSGNFAFEPSPQTIAFWLGGAPGSRDIVLAEPASKLGFFYASFVTVRLDAFDMAGNLVDSAVGGANFGQGPGGDPSGGFNQWDPLEVESDESEIVRVRVTGSVNQTGIDDLKVCRRLTIARIEVTQAIQEIQEIDDLVADLQGDREPPVPIIEAKPAVMRLYPEQVQEAVRVQVEVTIDGATQIRSLTLQPQCDPDQQRRRDNGCRSIDFYFQAPGGNWDVEVRLLTENGDEIETHELPLRSRDANRLVLRSVSVCDAIDPATGDWQCGRGGALGGLIDFLRRTAPTHRVDVSATNNVVRNDINTYDSNGNGTIDPQEVTTWFADTVADVGNLYGLWDRVLGLLGRQRHYYGMTRTTLPCCTGGIADGIPSRAAMSRESTVRLGVEVNYETVAHEVGHMLGRRHTATNVPAASGSPPGCYSTARDMRSDWPFADNRIQSANGLEVGFDVARRSPVLPATSFDWMGYCTPRWISPFTYVEAMDELGAENLLAEPINGPFWTISGHLDEGEAVVDPIFELVIDGPGDLGDGDHRIEVRDAGGGVLAVRAFSPRVATTETTGDEAVGRPAFFELLPVVGGAKSIAIVGPTGDDLAVVPLAGASPAVSILSPAPGALLEGVEHLAWSITDVDSIEHWSAVDYSTDDGETWGRLGVVTGTTLRVDFDAVAGSESALLRVTASDGVNSGSAISGEIAVSTKMPRVEIIGPADNEAFAPLDLVWLRANAYDPDDGFLDGASVVWTSSLDGTLGSGASLPLTSLSSGIHRIAVDATDSDGNIASGSIDVRVAAGPPTLNLEVQALDVLPTTCVRVDIDAEAASSAVGLATVEYSLDGGASWTAVPLADLPHRFIVPGEGFVHLVARTFDESGQVEARDERFFIDSPCEGGLPIADAGPDRTVDCGSPDGTPVTLDGSGSFDPGGLPLAYTWTGPFPEGGGTVSGVSPTVTLPFGTSMITLVVDNGVLSSAPDGVEITVALAVEGLAPPLASLVPTGEPPSEVPSFERGSTLPLRLKQECGGKSVRGGEAPRIVGLASSDGTVVDPAAVDLDAGDSNDGDTAFRAAGGTWVFNLSTAPLSEGTWTITFEVADGRRFDATFTLR